ncbi:helix-turn-helix domain-containing protein [Cytobacillus sp. Hm23]
MLFKPLTKLGKWMHKRGITGAWLQKETKLNKSTISSLTSNKDYSPRQSTMRKVIKALRKIDPNAKVDDFFDM